MIVLYKMTVCANVLYFKWKKTKIANAQNWPKTGLAVKKA